MVYLWALSYWLQIQHTRELVIVPTLLQITMIILSIRAVLSLLCVLQISSINFVISKRNVYIEANSHYLSFIELERRNAELIPTNISMQTVISSTVPSYSYYFDYFYYLSQQDVSCYQQSVQNQSYLFPCPFINNKNSQLRTNSFKTQQTNQSVQEINDLFFSFIIDNTLFPYPVGAYSYNPINLDVSTVVNMELNSSYQTLSIRLIFINVTVFLIFIVIIAVLVYKTRKLNKLMNKRIDGSKLTSSDKNRLNSIHQRESSDSEEEEKEGQTGRKMKASQHEYDSHDEEFKERENSMARSKIESLASEKDRKKSRIDEQN